MKSNELHKYIIFASVLMGLLIFDYCLVARPLRAREVDKRFDAAFDMAEAGDYDGAKSEFEKLDKEYFGKTFYTSSVCFMIDFCEACSYYAEGKYDVAWFYLDGNVKPELDTLGSVVSSEQRKFVNKMMDEIEDGYYSRKAYYDEEERKEQEARQAEREKKWKEDEKRKNDASGTGKSDSTSYNASHSGNSSSKGSKTYNEYDEEGFDPDDHDIDTYYEDYKDTDDFTDIDDAMDDFEDNPEYWDDY